MRTLLLERIKGMLKTFAWVTTLVTFGTSIFIFIFFGVDDSLSVRLLWEILSVSFLTSLGNFFYPFKEVSPRRIKMITFIQYLYINVVVLVCGYIFGWFDIHNVPMLLAMIFMIALIFFIVTRIIDCHNEKLAMSLNERLEKFNGDEEEEK